MEQRVTTQSRTIQTLKSRVLVSSPTRFLLDEIKAHQTEMEATLATLTVLGCNDNSVTMHTKKNLELQLQEGIEDMKQLKRVPTSNPAGPNTCKLIDIEKPGEDLDHEHTIHLTDVKNR